MIRVGRPLPFLIASVLGLSFALAPPPAVQAQTPAATVKDDGGTVVFRSFVDGGLLASGEEGTGTIPAEGAGTRLMWYPGKAAFRVGEVGVARDGTQWDADSIGERSVAFGEDTKASADRATAMGGRTTASGRAATAMGFETTASGVTATAMGGRTTASENQAMAMGFETTASAQAATAMGEETTADTPNSLSIGKFNSANTSDDNTLFVVGNGSTGSPSDALELDESGNLEISGSLSENSDRRLKTSVRPLGDVLGALRQIGPVRFRFKNERTHPSGEQIGLIAQDVQKTFPELVSTGSDGMLSLAYPKFSAVLLKGLQEQQTTIEEQQSTIEKQGERIATLETENEQIKKRLTALEEEGSSARPAGLVGPWGLALLLGLGGLGAGLLWRRRP